MRHLLISLFVIVSFGATAQSVDLSKLSEVNDLYYLNGSLYTGKVYAKHESSNSIGLVGEIKNGMKTGVWTYWYTNGQKRRESTFINNKKEGITYYWHSNGKLAKEIMFRGDKNIDQKIWDENGNRKKNPTFESFRQ